MVPATSLVSTIGVIADPEQTDCDEGVAVACGVGFTVIVKVFEGPVQPPPPLILKLSTNRPELTPKSYPFKGSNPMV